MLYTANLTFPAVFIFNHPRHVNGHGTEVLVLGEVACRC
jgi:hypothetical protein